MVRHQLIDRHVARTVEQQAERAVLVVLAQLHDAVHEVRVEHLGRRGEDRPGGQMGTHDAGPPPTLATKPSQRIRG